MSKQTNNTGTVAFYVSAFKGWQVKQLGSRPDESLLANMHGLGLRPGKQALACAMACRAEGVTGAQIVMACGAPQLNRMRGLIASGLCKREMVAPNGQGHTVYKLVLTAKGTARIERNAALALTAALPGETPVKAKVAKVTAKRNKAKVPSKAVEAPAAETPVTQPVTVETAPAAV